MHIHITHIIQIFGGDYLYSIGVIPLLYLVTLHQLLQDLG